MRKLSPFIYIYMQMRVPMVIKISPLLHGLLEIVFLSASVKSLLIFWLWQHCLQLIRFWEAINQKFVRSTDIAFPIFPPFLLRIVDASNWPHLFILYGKAHVQRFFSPLCWLELKCQKNCLISPYQQCVGDATRTSLEKIPWPGYL